MAMRRYLRPGIFYQKVTGFLVDYILFTSEITVFSLLPESSSVYSP